MEILTVSQINNYLSSVISGDENLRGIYVKGEISGFNTIGTGTCFFSLKDDSMILGCVMFRSVASRVKFDPEEGMEIIASGNIAIYGKTGKYQLQVTGMMPVGEIGNEKLKLDKLKEKLAKEGVFDRAHKKPLPEFPRKIGVVTSLNGAAVNDIKNILSRRYPLGELYLINALVQGIGSPDSVCEGIKRAEAVGCDVVIVGRGGGSSEDLSAFNTEKVVYAIYNCNIPVISAVGHETDLTLADFAADERASTPSEAAELVSKYTTRENFSASIDMMNDRLLKAVGRRIEKEEVTCKMLALRLSALSPENRLKTCEERLNGDKKHLDMAVRSCFENFDSKLESRIFKLDSLSPVKVLMRGYSLVYKGDTLINDADVLSEGDIIDIHFGKGEAQAEIIKK